MSEGMRVLVVDDESQIRRFLRASLTGHDYQVVEAANGHDALQQVVAAKPDLMILDLGLPDMDGLEILKRVREWSKMPIIVLSVREREQDKIAALDAGADDYLTKPFGVGELLARMRTAMRHTLPTEQESTFQSGELRIDFARRQVWVANREIKLTPTEYEILKYLAANAGKVVTHQQLLRQVWGPAYVNEPHYVRVYVGQLRHKIETDPAQPQYILTEPGVGYRLRVQD